jgi:hypothetical protein
MSEDLLGALQQASTSSPKKPSWCLVVRPYIKLRQSADLDSGCCYMTMHAWHAANLNGHIRYQQLATAEPNRWTGRKITTHLALNFSVPLGILRRHRAVWKHKIQGSLDAPVASELMPCAEPHNSLKEDERLRGQLP